MWESGKLVKLGKSHRARISRVALKEEVVETKRLVGTGTVNVTGLPTARSQKAKADDT